MEIDLHIDSLLACGEFLAISQPVSSDPLICVDMAQLTAMILPKLLQSDVSLYYGQNPMPIITSDDIRRVLVSAAAQLSAEVHQGLISFLIRKRLMVDIDRGTRFLMPALIKRQTADLSMAQYDILAGLDGCECAIVHQLRLNNEDLVQMFPDNFMAILQCWFVREFNDRRWQLSLTRDGIIGKCDSGGFRVLMQPDPPQALSDRYELVIGSAEQQRQFGTVVRRTALEVHVAVAVPLMAVRLLSRVMALVCRLRSEEFPQLLWTTYCIDPTWLRHSTPAHPISTLEAMSLQHCSLNAISSTISQSIKVEESGELDARLHSLLPELFKVDPLMCAV